MARQLEAQRYDFDKPLPSRSLAPSRLKAAVSAVSVRDFFGQIRESFAGAWQRNIVVDNREQVLAFSAVYACVTRIANDIAKLRIKLVEQNDDGTWTEVQRNSPYLAVLKKPNHYQTRIQFLADWLLMKLLYGNTYVLKVRDSRGIVTSMYVLDSRRVRPAVAPDGSVFYQVSSDELAGLPTGVTVPADYIIHDRGPTLFHPLCGVSPIFACAASATQGNRIQANSAKFFENMSRPSGMLTGPGVINQETADRLKADWETNFGGNSIGRLAVLGDSLKYEPMTIPAEEAQLIEQLKWTVEDVARTFAMPLYKIGAGPVPVSNNVQALQQQYLSDCLQSYIESIELLLDEGLGLVNVTDRIYGTELDLDGLLRMDSSSLVEMLANGIKGAVFKPNEARGRLGLPGVKGGEQVYLQQQNFSLEALAKRDQAADPFGNASPPAPASAPAPALPPAPAPADAPAGSAADAANKAVEVARLALDNAQKAAMRAEELQAQLLQAESSKQAEVEEAAERAAQEACELFASLTKGLTDAHAD